MAEMVEYRWSPSPRLYRVTHRAVAPMLKFYFHLTCDGIEHVPRHGAVVLASNHLSNLDPVLLAVACPRQINYLAKIELFRVPILGSLIRRYGAIPLKRSASDPDAIRLAECVLDHGQLLALFPEGTRSRDSQLKPFRFGAARLALKYAAPLVPAAIIGTDRAMPTGAKIPRRAPIRIAFGQPLDITCYTGGDRRARPEADSLEAVTAVLQAEVLRLKTRLEQQAEA